MRLFKTMPLFNGHMRDGLGSFSPSDNCLVLGVLAVCRSKIDMHAPIFGDLRDSIDGRGSFVVVIDDQRLLHQLLLSPAAASFQKEQQELLQLKDTNTYSTCNEQTYKI